MLLQTVNIKNIFISGKATSGWLSTEILLINSLELKDYPCVVNSKGIICEKCQATSHIMIVCRILGIPVVQIDSISDISAKSAFVNIDFVSNVIRIADNDIFSRATELETKLDKNISELDFSLRTYQLCIVNSPDHIRKINSKLQSNVENLFLTSEFMWLSLQDNPFQYLRLQGLDKTVETISNELLKICNEIKNSNIFLNFRGLDLRSDQGLYIETAQPIEPNPCLGLHGVRQLLLNKDYLSAELLAIDYLYSRGYNNIIYSLPFMISYKELEDVIFIKDSICKHQIKLGIWIETPAAVFNITKMLTFGISFVYIGTNDLTQLMLAVDRDNSSVSHLLSLFDPSVLNAINYVVDKCNDNNIPVYVTTSSKNIEKLINELPHISRISIPAGDYIHLMN